MSKEIRSIKSELRVAADGSGGVLKGYAVAYDSLSGPIPGMRGMFREKFKRGAFAACLKRGDEIHCFANHDVRSVLGRTGNGTLSVREDAYGLFFDCQLPDTTTAQDMRKLVLRGDINAMSFGFEDAEDIWSEGEDENGMRCAIRTVLAAKVFEVSPVTFPAYPVGTSVSARSRLANYSGVNVSEAEEKEIWRLAFDLQMRRDGF